MKNFKTFTLVMILALMSMMLSAFPASAENRMRPKMSQFQLPSASASLPVAGIICARAREFNFAAAPSVPSFKTDRRANGFSINLKLTAAEIFKQRIRDCFSEINPFYPKRDDYSETLFTRSGNDIRRLAGNSPPNLSFKRHPDYFSSSQFVAHRLRLDRSRFV